MQNVALIARFISKSYVANKDYNINHAESFKCIMLNKEFLVDLHI